MFFAGDLWTIHLVQFQVTEIKSNRAMRIPHPRTLGI